MKKKNFITAIIAIIIAITGTFSSQTVSAQAKKKLPDNMKEIKKIDTGFAFTEADEDTFEIGAGVDKKDILIFSKRLSTKEPVFAVIEANKVKAFQMSASNYTQDQINAFIDKQKAAEAAAAKRRAAAQAAARKKAAAAKAAENLKNDPNLGTKTADATNGRGTSTTLVDSIFSRLNALEVKIDANNTNSIKNQNVLYDKLEGIEATNKVILEKQKVLDAFAQAYEKDKKDQEGGKKGRKRN